MMLSFLLLPAFIMFGISFIKKAKAKYLLAFTSFLILLPIVKLFLLPKPYHILENYLIANKLDTYVLLVSSIVGIGVTLSLLTLNKHVKVSPNSFRRFYRFFAIFWIGLIFSILLIIWEYIG
jgi:hydrogenase-4 component F